MARKGENIYKRKDGRWEARYEKGRNSKGQIIYGSLYGKSYREVREKKINSIVKLPVTKTISPSESVNICDVSTRWLESIRHTVKESTYSCYLTLIQKHILTYFNNSSMITSEHIQQFINYKITNDLSPTSVRNIVVLLERILRYGEDENLLPITKRSFTFPKSSFYINDTLDASQLSILARYLYLEGDAFSVGLLLCMHTGIRIGELCGLKGGDFNFTNETFEIHRTISRIRNTESTPEHQDAKTKVIIGTPKCRISTSGSTTYAGVYTIPLNDDVELKPGTTFSVVVTLDRAVMDCEQATAIQKEEDFGTDKYVWMRQVSLYNYKSFYQSGSGFTPNIQNYCIKAYTSDGAKTEENSENLQGYTLTLDGSIGVNFYMDLSNEFAADDAYMEFSLPNGDTQQIKVSEAKKKDDSYVFTCKVAAKEMTADIQAQMVAGDVRGEMYTYNVKQYADYILAHTDAYSGSAVALVKSMLNYGAAAQQLFSYRTDTPANADLNEEDKVIDSADFSNYQYTVTQEDQVTGVQYYGSVLSLKSEICMKNYFLIDAGKSVDDYVFSIGSETGGKVILEPQEARINGKTCYYVTVKDIKAYDMDQNMTITVCENNQNETGLELHYGIFSYADAVSKLQNPDEKLVTVTKALYQYWEDAKQYQAEVNG